ncbi:metallophosphoesterase [Clostridium tagluense]|uniref:metallophosphoesterase n=1 Tax=Clostridium tagluense TaxID=360422 RepID=UPI001C6E640B|nr:metallophosphoesterase [Clostridium tagluense]MBW9155521.1 metallophosphoesterase family protein [Clostridium tagluense]WLC66147.1 metallophosphoesterase family protein [Clostridium tagluense]
MNTLKHLSKVFESSEEIIFDDSSKIVLMSDCHRGDGNGSDNFSKNQNIYFAALTHYYDEHYTYIEIGDGDELWENKRLYVIKRVHNDVFWLLSKFYNENRLEFIYGNHDIVKRNDKFVKNNLYKYFDELKKRYIPLFDNIRFHEGIVLRHKVTNDKIFLIHGHQVDCLNDKMWRLTRFLVRYLWRPLNFFGVNDPTRTAQNYHKKQAVEKKLIEWVIKEKQMMIAGHTHRPMFPEIGEPPYFNDGSCVHPRCITAMEIDFGNIKLVKWYVNTKEDGTLFVDREVLAGARKLKDYFDI